MNDTGSREWVPARGLRGAIDGGTVIVVLLWLGILLLVPSRPSGQTVAPPPPGCMISAWAEPLDALPLARRPDLVTLPSAVSFGAGGPAVDSLQGVPPFRRYAGKPLPPVAGDSPVVDGGISAASLRRAAAESLLPRSVLPVLAAGNENPVSTTDWLVVCSPSLGDTRLSAAFKEAFRLPGDERRLEVELWIQFDESGQPLEIFIEKSGNRALALELVRQLWNPAHWTQAAGKGRMTIRYLAGTGGINANTNN